MSNFIPEISGHFIFTIFGTRSVTAKTRYKPRPRITRDEYEQLQKIASDISQKSPDEIIEFLMIVSILGMSYSELVVKSRNGKKLNDNFLSTLKNMPLGEIWKREDRS